MPNHAGFKGAIRMEQPDIIKVEVVHREEVPADHADLFVVIKGSSLVTGNAALHKAQEVKQLVNDLTASGMEMSNIYLAGVSAEMTSGHLSKSSAASYSLRIRCRNLDFLADILGIVTAQKNATLHTIVWGYRDDSQARDHWMELALDHANRKAARIAGALGVKLLGVHNLTETYTDFASLGQLVMQAETGRARRMTRDDLGLEVSHSKKVELRVIVEYRVSGFEDS
jgi:uncharacterized protein YggE